MSLRPAVVCAWVAAGLGLLMWVTAGPINPPAGPVSPTGKTNQQVFDAVQGVNATASAAGRVLGVPGRSEAAGTIEFAAATGIPTRTTEIVGFQVELTQPFTGGLPSGKVQLTNVTVVRDLGGHSYAPFKAMTGNVGFPEVVITLNNTEGPISYLLTSARLMEVRTEMKQRADGTYAQLETLRFTVATIEMKTPDGSGKFNVLSVE